MFASFFLPVATLGAAGPSDLSKAERIVLAKQYIDTECQVIGDSDAESSEEEVDDFEGGEDGHFVHFGR